MRNIVFTKEKFKDESQLISGRIVPEDACEIHQIRSILHRLIPELIITTLIIVTVFLTGYSAIKLYHKESPVTDLKFAIEAICVFAVYFLLLPPIHELIHAVIYPAKADKRIWKRPSSYFVYCEAEMSRRRMVTVLSMPLILLGLLPLIPWAVFLPDLSVEMAYILLIADIYMIFICIADIGAIWVTLRYVPKNARVFSYGLNYYYRMNSEKQ